MALILNIETSTEVCSVNLSKDGQLIVEKEIFEGLNHSQMLTVFIDELFKDSGYKPSELNAVAVSKGPGSYTGLRIGVSVAKGMCYWLNIPLLAIGTLDAMGSFTALHIENFYDSNDEEVLFCPMIDARRMEVYTAVYNYKGETIQPVNARIINENSFSSLLDQHKIMFYGNGAGKCKTILKHQNALFVGPEKASARFMINLAEEKFITKDWEDVAYFEPFYLKDFIATKPVKNITK